MRIVTATHRDLESMVAQGTFREDLYYRLAVVPITVPPLRERPGDTARLVRHFVGAFAMSLSSPDLRIEDDAVDLLAEQTWPGNVRQVQNFLERLIVMAEGTILRRVDVERELGRGRGASRPEVALPALAPSLSEPSLSLDEQRRGVEKDALLRALAQADNNRTRAARILGVSRRTLYNKLAEYGVS